MARIHIRTVQKDLHDPDNHDGVITHLEPNNLDCEVKWALGRITLNKASEGDGIPAELFQILKEDDVKVLHSICQQIWKTHQWPQSGKGQFSFQFQRRAMSKNVQTTIQLWSFHRIKRLCSKSFKLGFSLVCEPRTSRCTSWVLKRQRNQRLNCQHLLDHGESKGIPEKISASDSLTKQKPLTMLLLLVLSLFSHVRLCGTP